MEGKVALFPALTKAETGEVYVTTLGEKLVSELADELEFQGVQVLWGAGLDRALARNNRSFRSYVDVPSAVALGAKMGVPLVVTGKVEHRVFSAIDRDWALNIQLAAFATDGSGGKARLKKRWTTGPAYVLLRKYFDRKSEIAVGNEAKKVEPNLANELRSSAQALAAKIRRVLGKKTRSVVLMPVSVEGRGIPLMVLQSLKETVEEQFRETTRGIAAKMRGAVARLETRRRNLMKQANTLEQRIAALKKAGAKGSRALAELRNKREVARLRLADAKKRVLEMGMQVSKAKAALKMSRESLKRARTMRDRARDLLEAARNKSAKVGSLLSRELEALDKSVASIRALQKKVALRFQKAQKEASQARAAAAAEAERLASIVEATIDKNRGLPPSTQPSSGSIQARSEARMGGQGAGLLAYEKAFQHKDVLLEMAGIRSSLANVLEERSKLLALQSKAGKERLTELESSLKRWEAKLTALQDRVERERARLEALEPKLAEARAAWKRAELELRGLDEKVEALSKGQDRLDPQLKAALQLSDRIARAREGAEEALAQERLRDPRAEALASGPVELGGQRFESLNQARMRVEELRRRAVREAHSGLRGQLLAVLSGALAERGIRVRVLGRDLKEAPRGGLAVQPTFKKIGDRFEFAAHFVGLGAPGARPSVTLDPRWTPLLQEELGASGGGGKE
ncbi:MAG TPA: hypothetical protein ENK02_07150 [Planctomycetes bacterium]|nr:hypothetical protein [Planctomycetota bacterium]